MIFAWPSSLSETLSQPYLGLVFSANGATALFVIYRCSSKELDFIRGIDVIAGSSMSGCANVTILYLPPLLVVVYLIALFHSVVSLSLGRGYSQGRWLALVEGFRKRRLGTPLSPFKDLAPPDPAAFEIDPEDPQSLLEAGSLWEMEGEWEKAIGLYELAAGKLRGQQDGVYAENCIQRVREKIARVGGHLP
jgi:hypothetical protein